MAFESKIDNQDEHTAQLSEKVIELKRVSKKTKGGNRMGFTALVAVGDKNGSVGIGLGKAKDVKSAIEKGMRQAKKEMVLIPLVGHTIPHSLIVKEGAAHLIMKPAPSGSGVIAGVAVRVLADLSGIKDISIKIVGTRNKLKTVYATMSGFSKMSISEPKEKV